MNDVDSFSLGHYPVSSPYVSSPNVLGMLMVVLPVFPSINWILTSNLYVVLHFDYSRLVIYIYIYDELKRLVVHFGFIWNFVASRSGTSFRCNRYTRTGTCSSKVETRRTSPIGCGCEW